jgi:hypothetical protein
MKGAVCMIDKEVGGLAVVLETRDPVLFARKFTDILESEIERYKTAKGLEDIGGEEEITYIDKGGEERTVRKVKGIDKRVSDLAFNILKGAKVISDIVTPKSNEAPPLGNQNILIVNEFNTLPSGHRDMLIKKFIDDKLDASKKDRAIVGECVPPAA